uniref:Uncharacterized protein n=1 Tax=Triticum urartu TaxID=4572 RepID=A0A8R7JXF2_TRIUA
MRDCRHGSGSAAPRHPTLLPARVCPRRPAMDRCLNPSCRYLLPHMQVAAAAHASSGGWGRHWSWRHCLRSWPLCRCSRPVAQRAKFHLAVHIETCVGQSLTLQLAIVFLSVLSYEKWADFSLVVFDFLCLRFCHALHLGCVLLLAELVAMHGRLRRPHTRHRASATSSGAVGHAPGPPLPP